ncbi:MAG: DUF547 domain-containing protein [Phycisphaerales bacterium]|nr:MAG: DUF547 domain-containing protein [Phycisphaerales bacterium]
MSVRTVSCVLLAAFSGIFHVAGCGLATVDLYNPAWAPSPAPTSYDDRDYATVLRENVKDGLVDYDHLKAHQEPLTRYLGQLSVVGPAISPDLFPSRSSRLAYYINAYNAGVLKAVLHLDVPQTVHDARMKPFDHGYRIKVDGAMRTLAKLRDLARKESHGDARVEFAMCDAALGSPPLADQPLRPDTLSRQLRQLARNAMDDRDQVRIDHEKRKLLVSVTIYLNVDAFIEHHTRQTGSRFGTMLSALLQMADGARRAWLNTAVGYDIGMIPFDRSLNRWMRSPRAGG